MVLALDDAKGKILIGWDWIIMGFFLLCLVHFIDMCKQLKGGVVWPMTCETLNLVLFLISKSLMEG
jgi:hypothetical protein